MDIPSVLSCVSWSDGIYQVRDRSRNKITGAITLYLCSCTDATCTHAQQLAPLEEVSPVQLPPPESLDYYTPPQPGDTVVIAATPFVHWMYQQDKAKNPEYAKRYDYNHLPPRKDKLDKWLWATCTVVQSKPPMAVVKTDELGTRQLPIECLRILKRYD